MVEATVSSGDYGSSCLGNRRAKPRNNTTKWGALAPDILMACGLSWSKCYKYSFFSKFTLLRLQKQHDDTRAFSVI